MSDLKGDSAYAFLLIDGNELGFREDFLLSGKKGGTRAAVVLETLLLEDKTFGIHRRDVQENLVMIFHDKKRFVERVKKLVLSKGKGLGRGAMGAVTVTEIEAIKRADEFLEGFLDSHPGFLFVDTGEDDVNASVALVTQLNFLSTHPSLLGISCGVQNTAYGPNLISASKSIKNLSIMKANHSEPLSDCFKKVRLRETAFRTVFQRLKKDNDEGSTTGDELRRIIKTEPQNSLPSKNNSSTTRQNHNENHKRKRDSSPMTYELEISYKRARKSKIDDDESSDSSEEESTSGSPPPSIPRQAQIKQQFPPARVFFSNFQPSTLEPRVRGLFSPFGKIIKLVIKTHRTSGDRFGTVTFALQVSATAAVKKLKNANVDQRVVCVEAADPELEFPSDDDPAVESPIERRYPLPPLEKRLQVDESKDLTEQNPLICHRHYLIRSDNKGRYLSPCKTFACEYSHNYVLHEGHLENFYWGLSHYGCRKRNHAYCVFSREPEDNAIHLKNQDHPCHFLKPRRKQGEIEPEQRINSTLALDSQIPRLCPRHYRVLPNGNPKKECRRLDCPWSHGYRLTLEQARLFTRLEDQKRQNVTRKRRPGRRRRAR